MEFDETLSDADTVIYHVVSIERGVTRDMRERSRGKRRLELTPQEQAKVSYLTWIYVEAHDDLRRYIYWRGESDRPGPQFLVDGMMRALERRAFRLLRDAKDERRKAPVADECGLATVHHSEPLHDDDNVMSLCQPTVFGLDVSATDRDWLMIPRLTKRVGDVTWSPSLEEHYSPMTMVSQSGRTVTGMELQGMVQVPADLTTLHKTTLIIHEPDQQPPQQEEIADQGEPTATIADPAAQPQDAETSAEEPQGEAEQGASAVVEDGEVGAAAAEGEGEGEVADDTPSDTDTVIHQMVVEVPEKGEEATEGQHVHSDPSSSDSASAVAVELEAIHPPSPPLNAYAPQHVEEAENPVDACCPTLRAKGPAVVVVGVNKATAAGGSEDPSKLTDL
ncbi:unnamed protein product [Vitrella brassicaformis CCMP3155]|uniref:Uncharacterized protein n=1 Tax=Vitrella brassicaformis (strain CCMP3155) TaxID=1169540 RepID=A0A0G4FGY6_VITBC|nr:unnamed protein product [Vitrella brassicaformis CCMP3155]|eukprot:CEM12720.1 unnamed protein product [Vitrella brassicaformis CCMP3155]